MAQKVKTFTGADPKKVDAEVNAWLAETKAVVVRTNTALKQFNIPRKNRVTGKKVATPVPILAISIWYEEKKTK